MIWAYTPPIFLMQICTNHRSNLTERLKEAQRRKSVIGRKTFTPAHPEKPLVKTSSKIPDIGMSPIKFCNTVFATHDTDKTRSLWHKHATVKLKMKIDSVNYNMSPTSIRSVACH